MEQMCNPRQTYTIVAKYRDAILLLGLNTIQMPLALITMPSQKSIGVSLKPI
jgi:hypothetical protein